MIRGIDRDTLGGTIYEVSIIVVLFRLKLIEYKSNIPSNDNYF